MSSQTSKQDTMMDPAPEEVHSEGESDDDRQNLIDEEVSEEVEGIGPQAKDPRSGKECHVGDAHNDVDATQEKTVKNEAQTPQLKWSSIKNINSQWFNAIAKEIPLDRLA